MNLETAHIEIESELAQVEAAVRQQLRWISQHDAVLDEVFRAFFEGRGKMLRPRLVILSALALRQNSLRDPQFTAQHRTLISLGAIVELIHSASLMHDDVLDESSTRRGHPSLNARFGNKIAILAGDLLYSQAFEMTVKTVGREISLGLTKCVRAMCRAEVASLGNVDFEKYQAIINGKTASLMAFCGGAGVAVAREAEDRPEVLEAFRRFGSCFGMAYQLADDLRDDDSDTARANRDRVIALLREQIQGAENALEIMPPSVYRDDLAKLLYFVVEGYESFGNIGFRPESADVLCVGTGREESGQ